MIPLAQTGPMTEDERFMFECYGYLIIEDVMTPDEIDEALAASKRIHTDTTEVFSPLGNSYEREPAPRPPHRTPGRHSQGARALWR